jgi:serine/threonine protein kinase
VSKGEYQGTIVAIKRLRTGEENPDRIFKVPVINCTYHRRSVIAQRLCREVIPWKHLSHPNVLPLLGVSISTNPYSFRIFTEWMPNGNVMQYARSNPMANRLQLASLLAVPFYSTIVYQELSLLKSCPA